MTNTLSTMIEAGEIIITLSSTEKHYPYDRLSVSYDSSDSEILEALKGPLMEEEGFDIDEQYEDGSFTIKRVEDSHNIYIFPKSTAGI